MSETNLVVEALMVDKTGTRLKSVSWMEFTFVSLANGRPARHPEEMMELFRAVVVDEVETAAGFEQRIQDLRALYRGRRREQNGVEMLVPA
jgi:hypothetical protein